uniref:hypothetical protein n=1 Tax=uncultured Draconibacterium sp. TaxID=1573823 RepID=UPI003216C844
MKQFLLILPLLGLMNLHAQTINLRDFTAEELYIIADAKRLKEEKSIFNLAEREKIQLAEQVLDSKRSSNGNPNEFFLYSYYDTLPDAIKNMPNTLDNKRLKDMYVYLIGQGKFSDGGARKTWEDKFEMEIQNCINDRTRGNPFFLVATAKFDVITQGTRKNAFVKSNVEILKKHDKLGFYMKEGIDYLFGAHGKTRDNGSARYNFAYALGQVANYEALKQIGITTPNEFTDYINNSDRTTPELNQVFDLALGTDYQKIMNSKDFDAIYYALNGWALYNEHTGEFYSNNNTKGILKTFRTKYSTTQGKENKIFFYNANLK